MSELAEQAADEVGEDVSAAFCASVRARAVERGMITPDVLDTAMRTAVGPAGNGGSKTPRPRTVRAPDRRFTMNSTQRRECARWEALGFSAPEAQSNAADERRRAVGRARAAGATIAEIAMHLGISRARAAQLAAQAQRGRKRAPSPIAAIASGSLPELLVYAQDLKLQRTGRHEKIADLRKRAEAMLAKAAQLEADERNRRALGDHMWGEARARHRAEMWRREAERLSK